MLALAQCSKFLNKKATKPDMTVIASACLLTGSPSSRGMFARPASETDGSPRRAAGFDLRPGPPV